MNISSTRELSLINFEAKNQKTSLICQRKIAFVIAKRSPFLVKKKSLNNPVKQVHCENTAKNINKEVKIWQLEQPNLETTLHICVFELNPGVKTKNNNTEIPHFLDRLIVF